MKLFDLLSVYVWRENVKVYGKDPSKVFDRLYHGMNEDVPDELLTRKVLLFEALTDQNNQKPYLFIIVQ